jgi:Protein of unknown function (DUF4238)
MPDHKNQHFVPKCLLRQFAPDEEKRSLNVFNIGAERPIFNASLKSQASANYMYGKDPTLERHLAKLKGAFDIVLQQIATGVSPSDGDLEQIRFFMYLQFRRTEMAVKRVSTLMIPWESRCLVKRAVLRLHQAFTS